MANGDTTAPAPSEPIVQKKDSTSDDQTKGLFLACVLIMLFLSAGGINIFIALAIGTFCLFLINSLMGIEQSLRALGSK
jgi:hypothetical protein